MVKKFFSNTCWGQNGKRRNGCASMRRCTMPLSQKNTSGRAKVCRVDGDRKHCARLAALGLYPGNEIELVQPANGQECLIKVHGGTISIDKATTENILVTE